MLYGRSATLGLTFMLLAGCDFACSATEHEVASSGAPKATAPPAVSAARSEAGSEDERSTGRLRELRFSYATTPAGPMDVVIAVPVAAPERRFPVLVALHGRGEAFKGPERGARGWIDDYGLSRAVARLSAPPLSAQDLLGFVDTPRLTSLNRALEREPYRGLIVVCPYTPDLLAGERRLDAAEHFATFVVDELLPRVYRETPALGSPANTGIDGVSLGGRAALLVAFSRPSAFGVVGAVQAAFDGREIAAVAERGRRALDQNPKLVVRLLTSHDDYFLAENHMLSRALSKLAIRHRFDNVVGPHTYEFNRGPGVYEMLTYHDRALRGRPAP